MVIGPFVNPSIGPSVREAPEEYQHSGDDTNWFGFGSSNDNKLVYDSSYGAVEDWARRNKYNISEETLDYLYSQFFNEKNTASAWERTLEADSTKYQRAVKDMQAAGLNPFLAISNGMSNAGSSQSGSVGSGSIASTFGSKRQSNTSLGVAALSALAIIAAVFLKGIK